jgi:GT2 family glycosyltransferase
MITWNALAFTARTLESIRKTLDTPPWKLVVVDNGSTDGTPEWLRTLDWITLIENSTNLGFAKACNMGILAGDPASDIVLLNNDMLIEDPRWLSKLQSVAYAEPRTGIVGSRLVDGRGRVLHLGSYMPPLKIYGQQMAGLELDVNQGASNRSVESVVFAQAYIRRDCLDEVGLVDEDLFAYFEDSEYCLRARQAGWEVVCAGGVVGVHFQSTSTRENKIDFWPVYLKSRETFISKWADWLEHGRYTSEVGWHSVVHQPMGYAVQSRQIMKALHFAGVRVTYRNAYGTVEEPTDDVLVDDLVTRQVGEGMQIGFCQADAFPGVSGSPRVGWTMLEVTGLPGSWVDGCNAMDEVWVPASFNVETFRNSGVKVPIRVMPLGVDTDYFHPEITAHRPSERFVFLSVFEWGERKAPEILLRAFCEEFGRGDDVLLLLSITNRDPMVDVDVQIAAMGLPAGAPIVVMKNAHLPSHQMGSLYRSADCFVLPSRGEGWGMPVLEAMACGLPAIATNWSGPSDFLTEANGFPLNVKSMVKAEARCVYYEGFEWAEPDPEHLKHLMRQVYEDPDGARKRGLAAAESVAAEEYTWRGCAGRIRQRLQELGA